MIDAIETTHIAMLQDQLRLQSISQNITNMHTPGYKRQQLESLQFNAQLYDINSAFSPSTLTSIRFTQGTLMQSQNRHDLALSGDGFFEVQTAAGRFYTRRGDLRVNEQGELSLNTGALILGKSGPVHVGDNAFSVDSQGIVYIDNQKIDQLNIVQFTNLQQLNYQGQGLYSTLETSIPVTSDTHVLQGFIEQSNVKSADEMLEMLQTSRHFETSQRIMRTADSLLATAINQLGEGNV